MRQMSLFFICHVEYRFKPLLSIDVHDALANEEMRKRVFFRISATYTFPTRHGRNFGLWPAAKIANKDAIHSFAIPNIFHPQGWLLAGDDYNTICGGCYWFWRATVKTNISRLRHLSTNFQSNGPPSSRAPFRSPLPESTPCAIRRQNDTAYGTAGWFSPFRFASFRNPQLSR
jgi:hypothetical protein